MYFRNDATIDMWATQGSQPTGNGEDCGGVADGWGNRMSRSEMHLRVHVKGIIIFYQKNTTQRKKKKKKKKKGKKKKTAKKTQPTENSKKKKRISSRNGVDRQFHNHPSGRGGC